MPLNLGPLLGELTIQDKRLRSMRIPYDPATNLIGGRYAWAQTPYIRAIESQYNAGKPVRGIVLKARQLGLSTISEAVIFNWLFVHPGTHGLVLANESDVSEELFAKTKTFWETWPLRRDFHLKYSTKQNMHWLETGSQLKIATAGNRMSGRGHTLHAVHLSEVAFYPDPKTLMLGLQNSVPNEHGSIMLLESTAHGIGNYFYNMWNEAVEGGSDYFHLFFPWWRHPEYEMPTTISTQLELDSDEKTLYRMISPHFPNPYEKLQWRRWCIKNKVSDIEQFMQEFPATPEEAFRHTGTPVLPERKLQEAYHDRDHCSCHGGQRGYLVENISRGGVVFHRDRSGPYTIFKHPSRTDRSPFRYFVGADPSETNYGDLASIQAITRDVTKPTEQLATFSARVDSREFAQHVMNMGRYYNNCMLCPEAEGGGQACIATILERGYPLVWLHTWADKAPGKKSTSYGWSMNYNRKRWVVSMLQNALFNDQLILHDHETYMQLRDYGYWDNGEMGNMTPGGHDDAVMSLGIAMTASSVEQSYNPRTINRPIQNLNIYEDPPDAA